MVVAILSVPLLLQMLGTTTYGIWATLTSLIAFISLLDLGVGNSMRNSVAAMQPGNEESVKIEFVGFFQLLCCIGMLAALFFICMLPLLELPRDSVLAVLFLYLPLLLLLPLLLGASVLQGARATGVQSILQAAGGWLFFTFVAILFWRTAKPSLTQLSVAWGTFYAVSVFAIFVLALRTLRIPARRLLLWSLPMLPMRRVKVGLEFLMLQLSSLVLYGLGNVIIFNYLGPAEVARYDVLNKAFQVALSLYSIVIGVMWTEIAAQRAAGDSAALYSTLRKLSGIGLLFSLMCVAGALATPWVVAHWTGNRIQVTTQEAMVVALLAAVQSLAYVGAVFMNAFERIRAQIALGLFSIVLMVPLSIWLLSRGLGIIAVPLSATLLTLLPMFVCNFHAIHLVRGMRPIQASNS